MIYIEQNKYDIEPYESEEQLENDVWNLREELFGINRIYFNFKKKIGISGKTKNIPDGYLIDLSSPTHPKLFLVENELANHGLKHIAMQLLEFSLSYETSKHMVKGFLRDAIIKDTNSEKKINDYIKINNFQNIDYFLDKLFFDQSQNEISVIVVIDQVDDDLEKALKEKFRFPIEILILEKYRSENNQIAYNFEPLLADFIPISGSISNINVIDSELVDTIVVPAKEDGFEEVFLGENRWRAIRINASMLDKIKYIAAYQVAPHSSITHYAEVANIEQWQNSNKYVVNFKTKAEKINPIKLVPNGRVKALQNTRYTLLSRLLEAKNLDEAF